MIHGKKRKGQEYDGKFDPEMGNFLGSFSSVIVTCKDSISLLNTSTTTNEFKSSMNDEFENAKEELKETLTKTALKVDKLDLLTDIICKVNSIGRSLVKSTIQKNYSQDDYNWMVEFLEKMKDFLENQQKDVRSTSQDDFPTPLFMMPDENASTKQKPLRYFNFLFNKNGISQLRNNFIQYYESNEFANSTYNKETETITHNHYDSETGEWSMSYQTFNAEFSNSLQSEFFISRKHIDDYIDEQKEESAVTFFINRTLSDLNLLLEKIDTNEDALKYKDSTRPVISLIKHIHEEYPDFINDKRFLENKTSKSPKFFKLNATQATIKSKATDLHDSLEKNGYLSKECKNDFIKLFTGYQPSKKIIWCGQKGELKCFIDLLLAQHKIQNCKNSKWQITAANFSSEKGDFTSDNIKDTKKPKSFCKIEGIVQKTNT
jgi:hypothetical protein